MSKYLNTLEQSRFCLSEFLIKSVAGSARNDFRRSADAKDPEAVKAMEDRIEAAKKHAYLICARFKLKELETCSQIVRRDVVEKISADLASYLVKAEADLSALDENGQSTAEQIQERINVATTRLLERSAFYKPKPPKAAIS